MICDAMCSAALCYDLRCDMEWENGFVSPKSISDVQSAISLYCRAVHLNPLYGMICIHIPMGLNLPHLPFHLLCIRLDSNWSIFVQFALFVSEIDTQSPTCCSADKTAIHSQSSIYSFIHPVSHPSVSRASTLSYDSLSSFIRWQWFIHSPTHPFFYISLRFTRKF